MTGGRESGISGKGGSGVAGGGGSGISGKGGSGVAGGRGSGTSGRGTSGATAEGRGGKSVCDSAALSGEGVIWESFRCMVQKMKGNGVSSLSCRQVVLWRFQVEMFIISSIRQDLLQFSSY